MTILLRSLWKWIFLAALIAIAAFLFIHFGLPKTRPAITLPGGQTISLDTKPFNNAVNQILQKQEEQNQRINDLESDIRQRETQLVEREIPEAIKETNLSRSFQRMVDAWPK